MKRTSKAAIRRELLSKRDSLTSIERQEKSHLIGKRLAGSEEFRHSNTCLIYASFRSEVETDHLIPLIIKTGKRLALPITDITSKTLILCEVKKGLEELFPSTYGIREPRMQRDLLIPPDEIDLFIVPGVAFDTSGTRLGYGGGYYDRLLSKHKEKTIFALAFEKQIASRLPYDSFDIRVKKIFTEERVINCQKDEFLGDKKETRSWISHHETIT